VQEEEEEVAKGGEENQIELEINMEEAEEQQQKEEAGRQWGAVYARGAWWRKALRPSVRFESAPEVFAGLCAAFPDVMGGFGALDTPQHHAAVSRLAAWCEVALTCGAA
jgi:hypothetical protein